jgi:hypothetical protein
VSNWSNFFGNLFTKTPEEKTAERYVESRREIAVTQYNINRYYSVQSIPTDPRAFSEMLQNGIENPQDLNNHLRGFILAFKAAAPSPDDSDDSDDSDDVLKSFAYIFEVFLEIGAIVPGPHQTVFKVVQFGMTAYKLSDSAHKIIDRILKGEDVGSFMSREKFIEGMELTADVTGYTSSAIEKFLLPFIKQSSVKETMQLFALVLKQGSSEATSVSKTAKFTSMEYLNEVKKMSPWRRSYETCLVLMHFWKFVKF